MTSFPTASSPFLSTGVVCFFVCRRGARYAAARLSPPSLPLPSRPVPSMGGAGRGGVSDLNLFTATAAEPGDITDPPTLARPAPGGQQPYIAAGVVRWSIKTALADGR